MHPFLAHLTDTLAAIEADGLTKRERLITTPQSAHIRIRDPNAQGGERELLNLCANNYLGLADHPEIIAGGARRARRATASAWPRCASSAARSTSTASSNSAIARYLGKDDAILFAACFDANGGLFETLLGAEDAIISDALNHASIIDGVRLTQGQALPLRQLRHGRARDAAEAGRSRRRPLQADRHRRRLLDGRLRRQAARDLRPRRAATAPSCWSTTATPPAISAQKGRGTPALTGAGDRVDIITGTFGKTLGGAMGGFIAGPQPVIDLLRQRARPYLFSNALAPPVAAGSLKAIEIAEAADDRRAKLMQPHQALPRRPRQRPASRLLPGETPIIPVMLRRGHAARRTWPRRSTSAASMSPASSSRSCRKGKARIRTQMSAALEDADIDFAIGAFTEAGDANSGSIDAGTT